MREIVRGLLVLEVLEIPEDWELVRPPRTNCFCLGQQSLSQDPSRGFFQPPSSLPEDHPSNINAGIILTFFLSFPPTSAKA